MDSSNYFCSENSTKYVYDELQNLFLECPPNCLECLSMSECKSCESGYFLQFNDKNNFSCMINVDNDPNSVCVFGNETSNLSYSDYINYDLDEFNNYSLLYQWEIYCYSLSETIDSIDSEDGCQIGNFYLEGQCYMCPTNCEVCGLNENQIIQCFQCNSITFLNLTTFSCEFFSPSSQINKNWGCLNVFNFNGNYFCQSCSISSNIPTFFDYCQPCSDGCSFCAQIATNIKSTINVTSLFSNLTEFSKFYQQISEYSLSIFCFGCLSNYAYNSILGFCCSPESLFYPNIAPAVISGCLKCRTCHSEIPLCIECQTCKQITLDHNSIDFNYVNFKSPIYPLKIYYILYREAFSFDIYPKINQQESNYIQSIYDEMTHLYQTDVAANYMYSCTPCPITTIIQCSRPSQLDFLSIQKYFILNYMELIYKTYNSESCAPNFFEINRQFKCFYCPHHWNLCVPYKNINITFCKDCYTNSESFMVNNIEDLCSLLTSLENNEFSMIMNEFGVQEIIINILFDVDIEPYIFNSNVFTLLFSSFLTERIAFIENYVFPHFRLLVTAKFPVTIIYFKLFINR